LLLMSGLGAFLVLVGLGGLARTDPEATLGVVSLGATGLGFFWMVSPLVSGVAVAETHDLGRLLPFPIPLSTLAAASLVANLTQPLVLAELPIVVAAGLALAARLTALPATLLGVLLTFLLMLSGAHVAALLLHGLARTRRFRELALMLGLVL